MQSFIFYIPAVTDQEQEYPIALFSLLNAFL